MKTKLEDYQVAVCEKLDWKIEYGTYVGGEVCVDLEKYSPAGEDFIFTVSVNDFEGDIIRYWQGFDPEDHARTVHGMRGAPDSLRTLIEDADAIEAMVKELHDALIAVHEGRKTVDQLGEDDGAIESEGNISDEAIERLKAADRRMKAKGWTLKYVGYTYGNRKGGEVSFDTLDELERFAEDNSEATR